MVGAAEDVSVATFVLTNDVAAVGAAVEKEVDGAIFVANHDDGLAAYLLGAVVAGLGDLALVADVDPGAVPDVGKLLFEDVGVAVEAAVDLVFEDELIVVDGRAHSGGHGILLVRGADWSGARLAP